MKPKTAPTSPKYATEHKDSDQAWQTTTLVKPPSVPWAKIIWLTLVLSFLVTVGTAMGISQLLRMPSMTWLRTWWPTQRDTTTIVQSVTNSTTDIPSAVSKTASTMFGLAGDRGEDGVYPAVAITGGAVPLSSNGWLLTVDAALPSDENRVAIASLGQPQSVQKIIGDPATNFVFAQVTSLDENPIEFASHQDDRANQEVWVVSPLFHQQRVTSRRLVPAIIPEWRSSDRPEITYRLDITVSDLPGAAVLDRSGKLIGMLDKDNVILPASTLQSLLRDVIQKSEVSRPSLGIHYLNRFEAVIAGQPSASGALIGNSAGNESVASGSPAEKAGLQNGDIILQVDGRDLETDFSELLEHYKPADEMTLAVMRQKKISQVKVTLGTLP